MRRNTIDRRIDEEKYNFLKPIFREIASRIIQEIDNRELTRKSLSERLAEIEGIKIYTARGYINLFDLGLIYGTTSYEGYANGMHLRRLSRFLSLVGLTEDDSLIKDIKEIEPRFEYPTNFK